MSLWLTAMQALANGTSGTNSLEASASCPVLINTGTTSASGATKSVSNGLSHAGSKFTLVAPAQIINTQWLSINTSERELQAIVNKADLRASQNNSCIACDEAQRAMLKMLPRASFSYGAKTTNDEYIVNQRWNEVGGRKEAAFINTSVADYRTLVDGVQAGMEVVLLDAHQDGLAQMALWAQSHSGYDAIHILSHGISGSINLGNTTVRENLLYWSRCDPF